eukprot:2177515-Prymnesium_polylepis.1
MSAWQPIPAQVGSNTGGAAVVTPGWRSARRGECHGWYGSSAAMCCGGLCRGCCGCDAWRGGDGARRAGRAAVASGTAHRRRRRAAQAAGGGGGNG